MNTTIIRLAMTALLVVGAGYTTRAIFLEIERIVLTRIKKGFSESSMEGFAQALTGMHLDSSGRLVPIKKGEKKNKQKR